MSSQSVVLNTGNALFINTDTSKIFLWNNRYEEGFYNNSSYSAVTIPAGTLMGRNAATNYLKPLTSGASDGSQYPVGVLAKDYIVSASSTVQIFICVSGDVAEETVKLQGTDTLDTIISDRRIKDRIGSDTVGIILKDSTEMTGHDNS